MELDLHQLIRIFRRRWWILLLLTLLVAGVAYGYSSRETPLYQATATMVVNPGALVGSSDYSSLQDSQRLADTYVQLVNTQPMRDRVAEAVGVDSIDSKMVSTSTVQNTLLIRVTVTDPDPEQAATVANTFVTEFENYISEQNAERMQRSRSSVDTQITLLNDQVAEIDAQIAASPEARSELERQRQDLFAMISQLESDAARSEMQAATASAFIESVESAQIPSSPTSPKIMQTTILGAFVGLLLAIGVVALLEYLDNTVKGHTNIQHLTGSPLLASVPVNTGIIRGTRQVYVVADPQSGSAEAIRLLRTNLSFAGVDSPITSVAVSSSLQAEGKSTVSSNLAVAVANSGMAVALIDGDLRKPTQHEIFGVENTRGVTTFISDRSMTWEDVSQRVAVPGLVLIPSGPIPPNPAEMVASTRFKELIEQLQTEFDLVIVDTPPILQASDGLLEGSLTDGLLLVTQHGRTRVDALRSASSLIHQSGSRLIGVVVNRVDKAGSGYYQEGYYGSYYGSYN